MKKFVSVLMVIVSLFSITTAFASTPEELIEIINQARLELTQYYEPVAKGTVLYEDENIKVTATGSPHFGDFISSFLYIDVIVENHSNKNLSIGFENASINGWAIDGTGEAIPAGKKAKGSLEFFSMENTDITEASEVQEIEGTLYYFDSDSWNRIEEKPFYWLFNN